MENLTRPQHSIYEMVQYSGAQIAGITGSILLQGQGNPKHITQAIRLIMQSNDALRMRIAEENGVPAQSVADYVDFAPKILTFSSQQELNDFANEQAKRPISLDDPLCKLTGFLLPDGYGLIASLNHIIGDAWTLTLIGSQFAQCCAALAKGEKPEITAYSYLDYIAAEQTYLNSPRWEKDKAFWAAEYAACPEVTYLDERESKSKLAQRETVRLSAQQTELLKHYCQDKGESLFALFLCAWGCYINRTKDNTQDFYLGTAVLNRSGPREKNTMGMFINTAPVRFHLDEALTFEGNLTASKKQTFSVFRHHKYNYSDILKDIRAEHGFTGALYDVMLSYQNATITGEAGTFETTWHPCGMQNETLQIHIDDRDQRGELQISYDFLTEKLTRKQVRAIHARIMTLLTDAIQRPEAAVKDLRLLPAEEKALLDSFNDTTADYPREKTVHQLFEEQAERTPDKVALIACDRTLTYRELNEDANRIAHGLIAEGVQPGNLVAFMLPRTSRMIAAMLGILKAGAAYVPIDPEYPQERIGYMMADSGAKLLITAEVVALLAQSGKAHNPCVPMTSDQPCYCLFTSGSTGKPKGVLIAHRNIGNFRASFDNLTGYTSMVATTTACFDIFGMEVYFTLLNGLRLILANETQSKEPKALNSLIAKTGADILQTTPSKMKLFLSDSDELAYLAAIKSLLLGGESLPPELIEQIETVTPAKIYNMYGPTETTIWSTTGLVERTDDITIGKPIANTQVYIVDKHLNPTHIGVTGELCIAGDGVGLGYLNRPELTAEKFIENPFGPGKLYKTGDLAYWREDGNIVYVGRNDFQVKIRGLRIELGEIENAILEQPGINQAAVVVRTDETGRQYICAFYTGEEIAQSTLRQALAKRLPRYMVPHVFTHLNAMPLTTSGKTDRKALPEVDFTHIQTETEYIAPVTQTEAALAALYAEVLGCERVGREDNFFDLGGDSLKAIELLTKIQRATGRNVEYGMIQSSATLRELAERIDAAPGSQDTIPCRKQGSYPATPQQRGVFLTCQNENSQLAYNMPACLKLTGPLDLPRLQNALDKLVERQEALRTGFRLEDGEVRGFIAPDAKVVIQPYAEPFPAAFDLSVPPLMRCMLRTESEAVHYLYLDMHHIISDGSSMPILVQELMELYSGHDLPPLEVQYADYAAWLQEQPVDEVRRQAWRRNFEGELPVLELPLDHKRPDKLTFRGGSIQKTIPAVHIMDLAQRLRVTPFVLTKAVFDVALSHYTGAEDILVGTAHMGRTRPELQAVVGMFVNTLVLRGQPTGNKTFEQYVAEVERNVQDAFAVADYSFETLVQDLNIPRDPARPPLFEVMFVYQSSGAPEVKLEGLEIETTPLTEGIAKFSLTMEVTPGPEGLSLRLEYNSDLFEQSTAQRIMSHYIDLLECLTPEMELKAVDRLSARDKELLVQFNDTAADYPREKTVHQLFEEQVERTPDKVALIACDRTLTYRELNEDANRIAHGLISEGVCPGDLVAFMLPRTSWMIATMLGILKAGAAYVPIDPEYPQERIDYMMADSGAKLLITAEVAERLAQSGKAHNPCVPMASSYPCYCIYTSGSTGHPKGVLLSHQGVSNYCQNRCEFHEAVRQQGNCVLGISSIAFDISLVDTVQMLLSAKALLLANEEQMALPCKMADLITQCGVDLLCMTPSRMKSYLQEQPFAKAVKAVRIILLAGESVAPELIVNLKEYTSARIFNGYGPSETTIGCTFGEVRDGITIGKPLSNLQIYIVDQYLHEVPIGVTGEICVAGDGVGLGYLNRPELTAEKFIDNPFGPGKLYKTGDLAYWREDGNIVYVGRNDFQVKIRGLRIELGEIENAILEQPGINQAAVVVRTDETGRQYICAFYTGEEIAQSTLRQALAKRLPRYMVPHVFTHLEAMPLTTSGKTDRKALPEVDLADLQSDVEYVAPATPQEQTVVAAVQEVLHLERVGTADNFFDLGGDSLKAIELTANLERLGWHTEVKAIFGATSLGELAQELAAAEDKVEISAPAGDIPATPAQMRVYTAQAMQGGTAYNVPYAFKVQSLDPERLQAAVDKLVARHEVLRTRFENRNGQIMQVVENTAHCTVEALPTEDVGAFIRPFDLRTAPLLRVGYCGNTIMVDMHHIITDGGSMPVFLRELNELYMGRELSDAPVQYREFAAQEQDHTDAEQYWLSVYNDEPPVLEFNTDYPRGSKQSFSGREFYVPLPLSLHEQICAKCKALNITPYAFYLGAYYILLSKFSGNEDIVVGTPASGRSGKFLNTLGMFVNTLALRSKPEGEKAVVDFLQEVKTATVDALAYQDYPYGDLVKRLGIDAQGRNPLFDVMFAYQSEEMTDVTFGDEPAELLPIPVTTSKYDFTFTLMPRQVDVVLMVEYCTDLYKEQTMRRLAGGYRLLLEQMLDSAKTLKDLSVVSAQERQTLMVQFNDTAADYPREKTVHQFFEEQAERTPDKVALIACDRTLTYRELNEDANRIAHGLIAEGVQPGDLVAFMLPRTSWMIATMLGVLKAGAAYVPIDPEYPQERKEMLLQEGKVKFSVTEENVSELLAALPLGQPVVVDISSPYCALHTSGSTGTPKLSALSHHNIVNFIQANRHWYTDLQAVCAFTICTFDAFILETVVPLVHGVPVALAAENEIYDHAELEGLLEKHNNALMFATPTKLKQYLVGTKQKGIWNHVKRFIVGGEIFSEELLALIRKEAPNAEAVNIYGPTETSICATTMVAQSGNIHIGRPIGNVQVYIVDKHMNPTPIGVTGELCIAGDGVGLGYLNRPELTAEKFIENPFGPGKLYKTGDLAYWREDGNIVYVGRNDFQVKIRGLRIELGEIENAMQEVDGVAQAVVVVRKNAEGRQLICAFYTGQELDSKEIRSAIGQRLPKYMLPHSFTRLDAMPLTSSGKVSRNALPEVDLTQLTTGEYVRPEGELERQLAALMEQVLDYTPIGREDDFFDLGGDSLKAIELVSKAHSEGIYIPLQNVFDYPTVQRLAECIQSGNTAQRVSFEDVDFSEINKLLAKNTLEQSAVPPQQEVGNLLLAGATGYLGIHLLADYLEHDSGTAYCLVRGANQAESEKRLVHLLDFYFDGKYADLIGSRIQVLCGDLQKEKLGLAEQDYTDLQGRVDTVINTAASVKHYGSYRYFYEVNVETTQRLIDFCMEGGAKLIHISTLSVSGNEFDTFGGYVSETEKYFSEANLYIGQPLENVYSRSKFEAELAVLKAMSQGLRANIMRMGNLTNRASDGVFQINHESNAAAQRIKGMLELGCVPDYLISEDDMYVEFTPIDEAAQAVMTITRHFSTEQTVFHINSTKVVYLDKLIEYFTELGYPVKVVSATEFSAALRQSAKDTGTEHIFETFINDLDANDRLNYDSNIRIENSFTERHLRRLGFTWGEVKMEYLKKYIAHLVRIGFLAR